MQLVVLDAETLGFEEAAWREVSALGDLQLHDGTFSAEETVERCRDAAVVMTNKVPLTRDILGKLPKLQCISVLATGYNVIDLETTRDRGITVCNVPAYSTDSVAQHVLAMILHWTNGVAAHADSVRAGDWVRSRFFSYRVQPITELSDLTLGIIGFGDIGRRVGGIAHFMGANILASMRRPRDAPDWERFAFASTEEILAKADIISLHCPLTAESTGMINAASLRTMKPHALLLNTARGGLVVEQDLADALNNGTIGGAMLDVVATEPMAADNPLREARNCWITPHIAWASKRARERMISETAANVAAFQKGQPRNVVG